LRLGVVGGLVYPVLPAVLVIFLCVAAISPCLNRSVGKIGVNRLLFLLLHSCLSREFDVLL